MTGWNMPPGVSEYDIPGNRPEDELAERVAAGWRPHCGCGAFLRVESESFDREEDAYLVEYERRPCARCGAPNERMVAGYPLDDRA